MTIEQLISEVEIQFQRPLSIEEAERLLGYVAKRLPGRVHYRAHYFRSIDPNDCSELQIEGSALKIDGDISRVGSPMAFDTFHMEPLEEDTSKLEIMKFQLVPGWKLEEYKLEIKQLWEDTRRLVDAYFEETPNSFEETPNS